MHRFHNDETPTANFADTKVELDFNAEHIVVVAETAAVELSFNGTDVHGKVDPADGPFHFPQVHASQIWLRGAGATARFTAWGK